MNATLKQAVGLISTCTKFSGNSLYAERANPHIYVVYSYGKHFPLAVYNSHDGTWYVNTEKYSPTTSRHQSIVKQAVGSNKRILCDTTELLSLLNKGEELCKQ